MLTPASTGLLGAAALLAVESGPDLTGVAAIIVAITGLIGLLFAQLRRPSQRAEVETGDVTARVLTLVEDLRIAREDLAIERAHNRILERANAEMRERIDRRERPR